MTYEIFDPKVDRPLQDLPRKEAKAHFDLFVKSIPERIRMLQELVKPEKIKLDYSLESLDKLDEWFPRIVEGEKRVDGSLAPTPETFSVCNDLSMYLGEMLRKQSPHLKWELFVWGKKNLSYQRPVIMGFTKSLDEKYNIDFDDYLCRYAFYLSDKGEKRKNHIRRMYEGPLEWI